MGAQAVALIVSIACIFAGYICQKMLGLKGRADKYIIAAAFIGILYIVDNSLIGFLLISTLIFLTSFSKGSVVEKYVFLLPLFPPAAFATIPFPGINYLIKLSLAKALSLIYLAPKLFSPPPDLHKDRSIKRIDFLVVLLFVCFAVLDFRNDSFTNGVREAIYTALIVLIPYLVVSRQTVSLESLNAIIKLVMQTLIILSLLGLSEQILHWKFLKNSFSGDYLDNAIFFATGKRSGMVRISATLSTTLYGYLLSFGILAVGYLVKFGHAKRRFLRLAQLILGICVILTFSRGAWLSFIVMVIANSYFSSSSRMFRIAFWVGGIAVVMSVSVGAMTSLDEYGTFQYRIDLVRNSLAVISNNLLFGDPAFLSSNALQASRQGQGIIDIVNTYLGIALRYGLVTLTIFVGAYSLALAGLARTIRKLKLLGFHEESAACRLMATALVGFVALIATVSPVSLTYQYGYLLLALSVAALRFSSALMAERQTPVATPAAMV